MERLRNVSPYLGFAPRNDLENLDTKQAPLMAHKIQTIPYGSTTQTFNSHINDEQNYRTIFSGRFGSGKTSFLKEYFETNEANYEVFHLFPVNYQVAQNEDIFELIKYDILFKFIEKDWFGDIEPISRYLAAQSFIKQKGVGHLISILKSIEYHGINKGAEVVDKLQDIFKEYQKHFQGLNKNEFDLLNEFRISTEDTKGSIYEFDVITQYICNKIEEKKGNDSEKKETVLIIDDLDRIDPEHIFRLLNVFSAHFDSTNERQNKFGFDKIIFVCDIENIQKIFHHKYGADVDFNGYINKFYCKEFFEFDLSKGINEIFDKIKTRIISQIEDQNQKYIFYKLAYDVVRCLIKTQQCSIRDIEKFAKETKTIDTYTIFDYTCNSYSIVLLYDFLKNIYCTSNELLRKIDNCIKYKKDIRNLNLNYSDLIKEAVIFLKQKNIKDELINHEYKYKEIPKYEIWESETSQGTKLYINFENTPIVPTFELTFIVLKKAFEEIEISKKTVL